MTGPDTQALVDIGLADAGFPTRFMQPQYGALSAWSTIGNSNYNAFTFSARQRLHGLTLDFNYTFSHSLDDASGLQGAGGYGSAFIENPIRQRDSYATSDFDTKQSINASGIWQLPFGKGHSWMGNAPRPQTRSWADGKSAASSDGTRAFLKRHRRTMPVGH